MCDHATETVIIDQAKNLVAKRKMFTAFNITKMVRVKTGQRIPHNDVNNIIKGLFRTQQMDDYQRVPIAFASMPLGATAPFVYHPPEADPNDYDPNIDPYAASKAPTVSVPKADPVDDDGDPDDDDDVGIGDSIQISRQGNGFVRIPARFMRAIGIQPHGRAFILSHMDCTEIESSNLNSNDQETDDRNNLRIYRHKLGGVGDTMTLTVQSSTRLVLK